MQGKCHWDRSFKKENNIAPKKNTWKIYKIIRKGAKLALLARNIRDWKKKGTSMKNTSNTKNRVLPKKHGFEKTNKKTWQDF